RPDAAAAGRAADRGAAGFVLDGHAPATVVADNFDRHGRPPRLSAVAAEYRPLAGSFRRCRASFFRRLPGRAAGPAPLGGAAAAGTTRTAAPPRGRSAPTPSRTAAWSKRAPPTPTGCTARRRRERARRRVAPPPSACAAGRTRPSGERKP